MSKEDLVISMLQAAKSNLNPFTNLIDIVYFVAALAPYASGIAAQTINIMALIYKSPLLWRYDLRTSSFG